MIFGFFVIYIYKDIQGLGYRVYVPRKYWVLGALVIGIVIQGLGRYRITWCFDSIKASQESQRAQAHRPHHALRASALLGPNPLASLRRH